MICLWELSGCVCVCVCSGVQHPRPASIGKSPLLLTVCLDTLYLCSDYRSRLGLRAPMYSSCSFSLPILCSPTALFCFLSFSSSSSSSSTSSSSLFCCLFLSESHSRHTHKHSQHTEVYEHRSIHAHIQIRVHAHALLIQLHSGMYDWQYLRQPVSARGAAESWVSF